MYVIIAINYSEFQPKQIVQILNSIALSQNRSIPGVYGLLSMPTPPLYVLHKCTDLKIKGDLLCSLAYVWLGRS
jgi:hypothetical protein